MLMLALLSVPFTHIILASSSRGSRQSVTLWDSAYQSVVR